MFIAVFIHFHFCFHSLPRFTFLSPALSFFYQYRSPESLHKRLFYFSFTTSRPSLCYHQMQQLLAHLNFYRFALLRQVPFVVIITNILPQQLKLIFKIRNRINAERLEDIRLTRPPSFYSIIIRPELKMARNCNTQFANWFPFELHLEFENNPYQSKIHFFPITWIALDWENGFLYIHSICFMFLSIWVNMLRAHQVVQSWNLICFMKRNISQWITNIHKTHALAKKRDSQQYSKWERSSRNG